MDVDPSQLAALVTAIPQLSQVPQCAVGHHTDILYRGSLID